jgi:hypothetical protein
MKLNKMTAFGIIILLLIMVLAIAVNAAPWDNLFGGGKKKTSSNLAKKLLDTMTSKESADYVKAREDYWTSQGETVDSAKKKALEDLAKYKAEKVAKDVSAKISGYIGGAMTGVFTTVGATMEGVIRSTPAKQTYDTIMDKVKYNTNIEYKVQSVKVKNEIYWNRACDALEKLQPGTKCERPKAAVAPANVGPRRVAASPVMDPELEALLKQMK